MLPGNALSNVTTSVHQTGEKEGQHEVNVSRRQVAFTEPQNIVGDEICWTGHLLLLILMPEDPKSIVVSAAQHLAIRLLAVLII